MPDSCPACDLPDLIGTSLAICREEKGKRKCDKVYQDFKTGKIGFRDFLSQIETMVADNPKKRERMKEIQETVKRKTKDWYGNLTV